MPALTRFVLRHKALVALLWLAVAVAGVMTVGGTTHRMTNDFSMPGQAFTVDNQIVREYGDGGSQAPYVPVLTVAPGEHVTDPAVAAETGRVFAAIRESVPAVRMTDFYTSHDRQFVTRDDRTTFALVFTAPSAGFGGTDAGAAIERAMQAALPAGWHAGLTGEQLLQDGKPASKGTGIMVETMIGSLGALVILALVFGSFLALLPLLVGGVSVLATFLIVGGLTEITGISQIVEFLIALIGLGVAIDYSLLVVSRWREERAAGAANEAAVASAMEHAGRAVVFSGLTVAIGLLSMIVLPVPMLRSVGYGGVLVPLVSVLVAVTLLPVILASVGPRLDWPRRAGAGRRPSRLFSSWASVVYRHRWVSAVAGLTIMGLLMAPALSLHLGMPGASAEATAGPAHDALMSLVRGGVPSGVLTPAEVLTSSGSAGTVAAHASSVAGVYTAVAPSTPDYAHAGTAIVSVLPATESSGPAGQAVIAGIEHALLGSHGVIGVGGDGATLIDFDHAVYGDFPLMLALIAVATFLLLTRAFRSVLLAAKAVVFNLISLAAAYGVLTWVFQDGHGSMAVFGVPATGAITMWVPLMVFAFLFGLSMDYEVFILSRIREAYDRTGSGRVAVIEGLGRTGRLVTSAAAILMLSFVSMSTSSMTDLKILATGLGAGILVDAVVVRCLLVPAMVALFGQANWWLPERLGRVLRVSAPVPAAPAAAPAEPAAAAVAEAGSGTGELTGVR
ncbi:MAG TPA: MMPL family transporter [Trebonia sp.]|nr:MMPL family transporter [Trebonia sp.]